MLHARQVDRQDGETRDLSRRRLHASAETPASAVLWPAQGTRLVTLLTCVLACCQPAGPCVQRDVHLPDSTGQMGRWRSTDRPIDRSIDRQMID